MRRLFLSPGSPFFIAFLIILFVSCRKERTIDRTLLTDEQKRMPEYATSGFEVAKGLEVTLFASEPMLVNPTNIDVDEKGRVWVCEGYNYRPSLNPQNEKRTTGDRILILEDTDGDGKADNQKVFYQGPEIDVAIGICVLGNKVIVSRSPNVFVFTDTDGDDKADKKEILFTGMSGEQHDHGVHAFVFGPDGKLYFNYGNEAKRLFDKDSIPVTDLAGNLVNDSGKPYRQGMAIRCNVDGSDVETVAWNFRNPYELVVDSYGALWQSDNDDDGNQSVRINFLMEYGNYGYSDEMTGAGWSVKRTGMHEEIPKRHWHANDPGSVPNLLQTGAGSPTGILVYEGGLLPEIFRNQIIHADAGPNVVRAYPVTYHGAGYKAETVNILMAKDDPWFRPADVCVAPDGSLLVADWYDPGVGGHQAGDQDRGRIYRIAPKGKKYRIPEIDLSTAEGAVNALKSPNQATRYLAWTALNRMGKKAEGALTVLSGDENPRFRARALWLLAHLEAKEDPIINAALNDSLADIRMMGLRIAQRQKSPKLIDYIEQLKDDPSPQVRREAAISLRFIKTEKAAEIWTHLALQYDGQDRWYLEALGIGSDLNAEKCFDQWLESVGDSWNTGANKDIVWRIRSSKAIPLLARLIHEEPDFSKTYRYFRAFDFHKDPSKNRIIESLLELDRPEKAEISKLVLNHVEGGYASRSARIKSVLDEALVASQEMQEYVDLVKRFNLKSKNPELLRLALKYPNQSVGVNAARVLMENEISLLEKSLHSKHESTVIATLTALGNIGNEEVLDLIATIMNDGNQPLVIRRIATQSFSKGWHGENRMINMLEEGQLDEELKPAAAGMLFMSGREVIRNSAAKYLEMPGTKDGKTLPPINQLVGLRGDTIHGKQVYARVCSSCHVINGEGIDYGPGLSEIGSKLSKEGMYSAILSPDAGINFGYEGYKLSLKNGSMLIGMITSKTETDVTLKQPGNIVNSYKMAEIESLEMLENSLMTPNLQMTMTHQELVDLVEYLMSLKKKEGA